LKDNKIVKKEDEGEMIRMMKFECLARPAGVFLLEKGKEWNGKENGKEAERKSSRRFELESASSASPAGEMFTNQIEISKSLLLDLSCKPDIRI